MTVLAPSLVDLRAEVDARWPGRSRKVDGWYRPYGLGDPSDHWPDSKGMVHAIDITAAGINPMGVVDACRQHKGVCHYIIWNRQIYSAIRNFAPVAYYGKSPHTDHVHVSIHLTWQAESYRGGWGIASSGDVGFGAAPPLAEGFSAAWDHSIQVQATADWFSVASSSVDAAAAATAGLRF